MQPDYLTLRVDREVDWEADCDVSVDPLTSNDKPECQLEREDI
jgi:hypothetical protein